jgi:hypothetical protein
MGTSASQVALSAAAGDDHRHYVERRALCLMPATMEGGVNGPTWSFVPRAKRGGKHSGVDQASQMWQKVCWQTVFWGCEASGDIL